MFTTAQLLSLLPAANLFLGGLIFLSLIWVHFVSRRELERTAAKRALVAAFILPWPWLLVGFFPVSAVVSGAWFLLTILAPLVLLFPSGNPKNFPNALPKDRIDERTIIFSRNALKPGTENFNQYYADHPEHKKSDDRFRSLAGLMSPQSSKFEPLAFAAAEASFQSVEELASLVEGEPRAEKVSVDPETITKFIKGWALKLGADSSGVTELKDYHVYSRKGRGPRLGEPIDLENDFTHTHALAFSVEMDHEQLGAAPESPAIMESGQQYMLAGCIAVQLAQFLRNLGWEAEAHIDANYRVVCPLVARDAGLGEIGRMGLLMTPNLGPRVRLAVVTTNLPLTADDRNFDPSVLHFCSICKKCADICPPSAIPQSNPENIGGISRWQVNQEKCFTYWCSIGTDCGQCMKVCPYAHPNTLMHKIVRMGLGKSFLFRHAALKMDDLLYGRSPSSHKTADWIPRKSDKTL